MPANLFLHYAMDSWLEREFPAVEFERYADDAVLHCSTEYQVRKVRDALAERLESLGLRLHPGKDVFPLDGPFYRKQAAATAAWKSRRRALTAVASRPKCTELVSRTAQTPLGESTARLVPVKPVCDTAEAGQEPPRMS